MAGTATPETIKQALQNAGLVSFYNPNDPLMATYIQIASSYKTNKMGAGNFLATAVACQIVRKILYWKKTPGDCPMQSTYSFGPGMAVSKAGGFAGLGASSVAAGATLAGATGVAAGAALAATGIGLAVLPFTIWGMFSAHHAAAVAREQADICQIVSAVNPSFDQLDAAVAAGNLSAEQYIATIEQLRSQAKNALINSGVYQNCNAACYIEGYLNCVCDIRKILYQQSQSPAKSVAAGLVQSNGAVGVALAALAAKFAGVF